MPTVHLLPRTRAQRTRLILASIIAILIALVLGGLLRFSDGFRMAARASFGDILGRPPDEPGRGAILTERRGDRLYLHGGPQPDDDFDITGWSLELDQLRYGLGREHFPALIEPEFAPIDDSDGRKRERSGVLVVSIDGDTRLYPTSLLARHEVVNDVVAGEPIMVAFCPLAQLGAVYSRRIADHTLTFAVSGYTYVDPDIWEGRQAFVLWDRDTESLWWPPIGRSVSGPLIDEPLPLLDETYWSQTSWADAIAAHPDALVLKEGQRSEIPDDWPTLKIDRAPDAPSRSSGDAPIPPRWGENTPDTD
jgi:hypothetical protein